MRVHLGDWWTGDDAGRTPAHRVGAVFPDLRRETFGDGRPRQAVMLDYDHSRWIPLCKCEIPAPAGGRGEYPAMFSTYMPWADHERCSTCEVLSPAFDSWLLDGQSRSNR